MVLLINELSNYESSIPRYDAVLKNVPEIESDHTELELGKNQNFFKDILQILTVPKNAYTIKDIEHILTKYGLNENTSNVRNDNLLDAVNNLPKIKLQDNVGGNDLKNKKKIVNDISEILDHISNEIRNQTLYRKSASAQFTASTSKLEKELATDGEITADMSYAKIWLRLAIFISEVKKDYVDFYADLMQSYTEIYESFNENVQKASSEAVSTGDDGNNVSFDISKMQAGYDAFQNDVDRLNGKLGYVQGWETMSLDQKKHMTTTLEPAYKVDQSNGKISFNMDQYNSVSGTYPSGIKDGKVSTASYQAWLATFNAAGNAFQSNMQSFAQRYSQANNNFDTLNKILSSAISTMADSAKDVLKSLS